MSIFENVKAFPPDPIFGLSARFKKDKKPSKVDLTVGVFKDKDLKTLTQRSVKEAEKVLLKGEKDKTYLPISGSDPFIQESQKLIFGEALKKKLQKTLVGAQSLGGTGALRLAGDFLFRECTKTVYVSDPTWPNHYGIFEAAGLEVKKYPYYNSENHSLDFERLLNSLSNAKEHSAVVLHACCHNPTGCDPSQAQWKELSSLMLKNKLIPVFDFAYQGFGQGIDEDAWAVRHFAEQGHEMFVAASYSKNFGLYGERVGSLSVITKNEQIAQNVFSVVKRLARVTYSNPPRHGSSVVATILQDVGLTEIWKGEVDHMRERANEMRTALNEELSRQFGKDRFSYLKRRFGMFSMLGILPEQVERMMEEYGVYLTKGGRVNLTGLSEDNLPHVIESIVKTMG